MGVNKKSATPKFFVFVMKKPTGRGKTKNCVVRNTRNKPDRNKIRR